MSRGPSGTSLEPSITLEQQELPSVRLLNSVMDSHSAAVSVISSVDVFFFLTTGCIPVESTAVLLHLHTTKTLVFLAAAFVH